MNFINLHQKEWLEIVFAHRNQEYGAYVLRKNNNRNHLIAFTWIILLAIAISSSYFLHQYLKPNSIDVSEKIKIEKIITIDLNKNIEAQVFEKKEKKNPHQSTKSASNTPAVKQNKWVSPRVVDNPKNSPIPTMDELKHSVISNMESQGIANLGNITPSQREGNESGMGDGNANTDTQNIFNEVEVNPEFLGGKEAWSRFLTNNLQYPEDAKETGISGKVILQFVIEKDGQLSDIKVIKSLHKHLDEAAIQALKKSPRWRPGFQNGLPVRVRFSIPISFKLQP